MEQDGHERSFRGRKAYLRAAGQAQLPEADFSGVGEKGCYRGRARKKEETSGESGSKGQSLDGEWPDISTKLDQELGAVEDSGYSF